MARRGYNFHNTSVLSLITLLCFLHPCLLLAHCSLPVPENLGPTPSSSRKPPFYPLRSGAPLGRVYLGTDSWMLLFVSCHLNEEASPEAKRSVAHSLNQKSSFVLAISSPRATTLLKSCLRYQHLREVSHARIAWGAEGSSDEFDLFQAKYDSLSSPEDTNP